MLCVSMTCIHMWTWQLCIVIWFPEVPLLCDISFTSTLVVMSHIWKLFLSQICVLWDQLIPHVLTCVYSYWRTRVAWRHFMGSQQDKDRINIPFMWHHYQTKCLWLSETDHVVSQGRNALWYTDFWYCNLW